MFTLSTPVSDAPPPSAPSDDDAPLRSRLAWLTGLRIASVTVLGGLLGSLYLRAGLPLGSFSVRVVIGTLVSTYALATAYAAVLRWGKHLRKLAIAQIVVDQLTWTVLVYVSGGATSGATAFYGLTCLSGAILMGLGGATIAAVVGTAAYSLLCFALVTGLLDSPPDQPHGQYASDLAQVLPPFLINVLATIVVTLLAGWLAERLRLTGGRLQAATARAEQAERLAALGRLTAGLAHEIRNPLGSIVGSVQLLRSAGAVSDEGRELCAIVEREASRLNDLVDDMLQLTGPRRPVLGTVDLCGTMREVVELARQSGRGRDVRLRYEGPGAGESVLVRADGAQLRQVAWNLVRNAVQASNPGAKVRVRVRVEEPFAILEVEDAGVGIAPESRAHLFDAFFTTRSSGMGIGLAVVKRIVDEHGWAIDVESVEGRGTTFRVRMTLADDSSGSSIPPPA